MFIERRQKSSFLLSSSTIERDTFAKVSHSDVCVLSLREKFSQSHRKLMLYSTPNILNSSLLFPKRDTAKEISINFHKAWEI